MNYKDWEKIIPETIAADPLWTVRAYRLALFVSDIGWRDTKKLAQEKRMIGLADQL